jgi:inner membrane protein
LIFLLRSIVARCIVASILIAGIALTFLTGLVPTALAILYAAVVAVMVWSGRTLAPRAAIASGIALWFAVTTGFVVVGLFTQRRIEALAATTFPEARMVDHVLTPMPVNPLCWELILIQREADSIVLRRAMHSIAPSWLTAQRCPGRSLDVPITAPLQKVAAADTSAIQWHGEVRSSANALAALWAQNCQAAAFMRFARAPWLAEIDGTLVIGDLRYDREAALGFAEYAIAPGASACPTNVPPWIPPRIESVRS